MMKQQLLLSQGQADTTLNNGEDKDDDENDEEGRKQQFNQRTKEKLKRRWKKKWQKKQQQHLEDDYEDEDQDYNSGPVGEGPVVDCVVTAWSDWSECSVTCGKGVITKTRMIRVQPQNGGRRCPRRMRRKKKCRQKKCRKLFS